ncbi:MAG: aromatic acid exporter family protein [Erysipelotrichales bacterium]
MNNKIYLKIFKIAIGGCLAFIIAQALNLEYAISASIITLLTIQDTKKETIFVALKRFGSFIVAMLLATIIFTSLGYSPLIFGLFILLFCFFCYLLKFEDGIASSLVLATHIYLLNQVSINILWNESMLMIVGVCIGVLLNMIMQDNISDIKHNQKKIERLIKQILDKYALSIIDPTLDLDIDKDLVKLDKTLKKARRQSNENTNNSLIGDTTYYISYVDMRKNQTLVLKHINNQIRSLEIPFSQANKISLFLQKISLTLHENNNASNLLDSLDILSKEFKNEELPKTRVEFEHRALLYSLLNDLQTFLEIKNDFAQQLTKEEIRRFQN